MALDPAEVGARITHARKKKGWTHAELADQMSDKLGHRVNLRTVQRWQKGVNPKDGKSWLPRLGTLMILAEVLEVPNSYFVESVQDEEARLDRLELAVEETLAVVREIRETQAGHARPLTAAPEPLPRQ